jgi:hypothetical protein
VVCLCRSVCLIAEKTTVRRHVGAVPPSGGCRIDDGAVGDRSHRGAGALFFCHGESGSGAFLGALQSVSDRG